MPNPSKFSYEAELDGLRALAVIGVILFHLGVQPVSGGFTGVDFFFVLSGYLITALIVPRMEDKSFSFIDFYIRRARRLLPALFVVILCSTIASWLLLSPDHLASFSRSAFHAAISVSNVNFWLESGYFDADKFTKPLLHTWSLGVEEQFYLLWPLCMLALAWVRNRIVQILILILVVAIGFAANIHFIEDYPSAVFYLSPFRAWQFAAGGLVALILHQGKHEGRKLVLPPVLAELVTLAGLALVAYSFMRVTSFAYPGWQAVWPTLAALLLILGGRNVVSGPVLANPVARFLGRISYSLYLTHWPLIVFWRYYNNAPLTPVEMGIVAVLSVMTAVALFKLVETPLRHPWTSDARVERLAVPTGIFTGLTALLIVSVYPWSQGGWSWRLSPESQQMVAEMTDADAMKCRNVAIKGIGRQCFFGKKIPPKRADQTDVIVLGDSHAAALAKGLVDLLNRNKLSGVRMSTPGMLPLYGGQTYDNDKGREEGFDARLEWAAASDAQLVIIHARFSLHWLTERPAGNKASPTKRVGLFGQTAPESTEQSQANFRQALSKTVALFEGSKAQVVLVGAVPYQGVNFNQCINRPDIVMSVEHMLQTCDGFSREEALERARGVNAVLKDAVAGTDIMFIDPTEIYCPDSERTCLRIVNKSLVFKDEDHLSRFGARMLARRVLQAAGLLRDDGDV